MPASTSINPPLGTPRSSRRVLGHGAIYVGGLIIQRSLGILLLPIVTRVLGVEQYGLVGTASALGSLLAMVYGLGLNFAITRFYYDDPPDAQRSGWAALMRAQALAALALAVLTYATGPLWSSLFNGFSWDAAFKFAVVFGFFSALQSTAQGVLRAAQRPRAFVVVTTIQLLIGSGLAIGMAVKWGAAGYMAGLSVGSFVALAMAVVLTYQRPHWSVRLLWDGLRLSLPAMAHQLSTWGIELADRLLIAAYLGPTEVGRYQVAYVLGSALTLLLTGLQSAWAPHYMGNLDSETRRRTPPLLALPLSILAGIGVFLLILATPILLKILAPGSFGGTELITALVASATMPRAAYFMAVVVLTDRKNTRSMAIASLTGVVLNIGLNVALIPSWGLIAAAMTTVIAVVAQSLLVLFRVQQMLNARMRIPQLCLVWAIGIAALAAVAEIPSSLEGLLLRIILATAAVLAGWMTVRWLRAALLEAEKKNAPTKTARLWNISGRRVKLRENS
jgi:O-antigen/teichoic acid export membrane protein